MAVKLPKTLVDAVYKGRLDGLLALLRQGCDPSVRHPGKDNAAVLIAPLALAVLSATAEPTRYLPFIDALLEAGATPLPADGADLDCLGHPLAAAAVLGDVAVMTKLLARAPEDAVHACSRLKDGSSQSLLELAAFHGNADMFFRLRELGLNPTEGTLARAMDIMATPGRERIVQALLEEGHLPSRHAALLQSAAKAGYGKPVLACLVRRGYSLEEPCQETGVSALANAIALATKRANTANPTDKPSDSQDMLSTVQGLLDLGAQMAPVDMERPQYVDMAPVLGLPGTAARHRAQDSRKHLRWESNVTLLSLAARYASADIVEALLQAGHPVDTLDDRGRSELSLLAMRRWGGNMKNKIAHLLLDAGANPKSTDDDRRTPADHWMDRLMLMDVDQSKGEDLSALLMRLLPADLPSHPGNEPIDKMVDKLIEPSLKTALKSWLASQDLESRLPQPAPSHHRPRM